MLWRLLVGTKQAFQMQFAKAKLFAKTPKIRLALLAMQSLDASGGARPKELLALCT